MRHGVSVRNAGAPHATNFYRHGHADIMVFQTFFLFHGSLWRDSKDVSLIFQMSVLGKNTTGHTYLLSATTAFDWYHCEFSLGNSFQVWTLGFLKYIGRTFSLTQTWICQAVWTVFSSSPSSIKSQPPLFLPPFFYITTNLRCKSSRLSWWVHSWPRQRSWKTPLWPFSPPARYSQTLSVSTVLST